MVLMDMNDEPVWEEHDGLAIISLPDGFVSKKLYSKQAALACVIGLVIARRLDLHWASEYAQIIERSGLPKQSYLRLATA